MSRIILLLAMLSLLSARLFGQINPTDSTVQVVGYWANEDKQSFNVSLEKYKVNGADTSARELIRYEVDITIRDSTASNYVIEWYYKNFDIQTDNPLVQKIAAIAEDMPVLIRTDEFGVVQEVVNWEEVREYMQKATRVLQQELKDMPNAELIIGQVMNTYTTKEAIEANAIKDVQQFYTFHGAKYKLGESLTGEMQLMNNFGGEPFDTELTVLLEEINEAEDNALISMHQVVNARQLTDATYAFLQQTGSLGNQLPAREQFPTIANEIWTASIIHGGSGWTVYSIETKQVSAENTTTIEERIIELK